MIDPRTFLIFCLLAVGTTQAQNVGIGTSNPTSKLAINGNLSIGSGYESVAAPTDGAIIKGTIGLGTTQPDSNAILDISSTSKGLLLPRLSTAQRKAMNNPSNGMLVYDTDSAMLYLRKNNSWNYLALTASSSGSWATTGNAGTSPSNNFIGTTDNQSLVFRVNNIQSGKIDQPLNNTSFGYQTAASTTTGSLSTYIGYQAGYANTTGSANTATGFGALKNNTTAVANTAFGTSALFNTTTGGSNTCVGAYAMQNNGTGSNNTAMGYASLGSNSNANGNTAYGAGSMQNNGTGINNTAVGNGAMQSNSSGSSNAGLGAFVMQNNTTGIYNVAMGYTALANNSSGGNNVAIGNTSGGSISTGSNNTFLGSNADASSGALTNATAIGYNARVAASNALVLGGTGSYAVNVGIGTTSPGNFLEVNSGNGGSSGLRLKQLPTGAVLFMSSSADVAQNNNNFYFDATNYRLGVAAGTTPNSTLTVGGSEALAIATKTATYTASASDHTILCNNTTALTITLPLASGAAGRIYVIKKISAAGNNVTIQRNGSGSDLIDGASSVIISVQYSSYMLQSDGTNWYTLAKN